MLQKKDIGIKIQKQIQNIIKSNIIIKINITIIYINKTFRNIA